MTPRAERGTNTSPSATPTPTCAARARRTTSAPRSCATSTAPAPPPLRRRFARHGDHDSHGTVALRCPQQLARVSLEQLGAGGFDSVRGYNPRAASGSQGFLLSNELRSPSWSPLQEAGADIQDSGQLLVFHDYGYVGFENAQPSPDLHLRSQSKRRVLLRPADHGKPGQTRLPAAGHSGRYAAPHAVL